MRTLTIGLILISTVSYSQSMTLSDEELYSSGAVRLIFAENSEDAVMLAKGDISKGTPFLLLQGGIAPIIYLTDNDFEKKYEVNFFDYGCVGPDTEISKAYNWYTFKYLTNKYGSKWIRKVRKDVIGLRSWKQERTN